MASRVHPAAMYGHTMRVTVRVTARASRDEVHLDGSTLRVRVSAAPIDGKANEAVKRLLAGRLGLRPTEVTLVNGATSRLKAFELPLTSEELAQRLAGGRDQR